MAARYCCTARDSWRTSVDFTLLAKRYGRKTLSTRIARLRQQCFGLVGIVAITLNLRVISWHPRRQNASGDHITLPLDLLVEANFVDGIVECLPHLR